MKSQPGMKEMPVDLGGGLRLVLDPVGFGAAMFPFHLCLRRKVVKSAGFRVNLETQIFHHHSQLCTPGQDTEWLLHWFSHMEFRDSSSTYPMGLLGKETSFVGGAGVVSDREEDREMLVFIPIVFF